ncbi:MULTISPECIES: helix-turn-helix transcriptional regulator [environmental samples]|uniref:helix-turn-helix domain-containing protein n=1 Tax=environmental samples TaxID=876090 RepID=UPI0003362CAB|nr:MULTISPECIES: helix-turn-helix transcriptional regulator [environmental samples]CDC68181.1 helix-turn-helix domain protein [Oscillibacter sp. CAG:155]
MKIFGERLKLLRREKKKTQREMAEFLGVQIRAYQYYESGSFFPEIINLIKLADYFDVSTDYLLGRSDQR